MQGLYKLALVGTREQLTDFLKKVNDNDPNSVFNEYAVEEGTGLRTTRGHGLEKFLDRCKLVIENTGSGNINGIEEMASEIGQIAPELELMLLTQYLDYSDDYTWLIYYKPAGRTEPSETSGVLFKGPMGDIRSVEEVLSYNVPLDIDREKFKEYLDEYDDCQALTFEEIEPFLDALADPDRIDFEEFENTFDMYSLQETINDYLREQVEDVPYDAKGVDIPSIQYIARLFGNCGIDFGVSYRFRPETFDTRFTGKTFVLTGEPDDYGKDGAKEIIEKFGGVVRGAVSGKTDYLLVGAYAGAKKIEKAHEMGTSILDTDDFEQMIS